MKPVKIEHFLITRVGPKLALIGSFFLLSVATCDAQAARQRSRLFQICQSIVEGAGFDLSEGSSKDILRSIVRRRVNLQDVLDHVERVYRSMLGQGPVEVLDLSRFIDRVPEAAEMIEQIARQHLDRLFRVSGGYSYSQREEEFGHAPIAVIATHLPQRMQRQLDEYQRRHSSYFPSHARWLFLVDPVSREHLLPEIVNLSTLVRPSTGGELVRPGEFGLAMSAPTIQLMGGYLDSCFSSTLKDAVSSSLLTPGVREVVINIHTRMTYIEGDRNLAELKNQNPAEYHRVVTHFREVLAGEFGTPVEGPFINSGPVDHTYRLTMRDGKRVQIRFVTLE